MYLEANTIGERIMSLRNDMSMSQTELAQKIGVSVSAVSKYEKGVITPKEKVLFALCLALDTEYSVLVHGLTTAEINEKRGKMIDSVIDGMRDGKSQEEVYAAQKEVSVLWGILSQNKLVEELRNKAIFSNLPWEEMADEEKKKHPILAEYMKLNAAGRMEAVKRIHEMTLLEEYTAADNYTQKECD